MKKAIILFALMSSTFASANSATVVCKIEKNSKSVKQCVLGDIRYIDGFARISTCQIQYKDLLVSAGLNNEGNLITFVVSRLGSNVGFVSKFEAAKEPFQLGVHRGDLGDGLSFACGD